MKKSNITLDFTVNQAVEDQELAVMPAGIAKRALKALAASARFANAKEIIGEHIADLSRTDNIKDAIQLSLDFVNERSLMSNIKKENWDAYSVPLDAPSEPKVVGKIDLPDSMI